MRQVLLDQGTVLGGSLLLVLLLAGVAVWGAVLLRVCQVGMPMPKHLARLKTRHWTSRDILVVGAWVGGVLILYGGMGYYLRRMEIFTQWRHTLAIVQNTLLQLLIAVLVWFLIRAAGSTLRTSFGGAPDGRHRSLGVLRQAFFWYVLSLPAVIAAASVSQGLFRQPGDDPMFQPVLELFMDASTPIWFRWWIVVVAVLVAPIIEEAFFRGMLIPVLLRKYTIWPSLVGGALLFALVHGHAPAILPLFVLGVGLGGAYLYTGNLLVPICMHALFNGVNLFVLLLSGGSLPQAMLGP